MRSKRLRANRNRFDRSRIQNQIRKEVSEPFMDIADKELNEGQDRQEPSLDLQKTHDESLPQMDESAQSTAEQKTKAAGEQVESQASIESAVLDSRSSLFSEPKENENSEVKLGDLNINQNTGSKAEDVNNTLIMEPDNALSIESSAWETENLKDPETNAGSSAQAETVSCKTEDTSGKNDLMDEDPDRVPVAPTLRDDEVPNRPGAILLHAREILGLPLSEVARKLNLRVNTVSDLEHDRLNQPTAVPFASVHIANYAKLVNIDPAYLVDLYKKGVEQVVRDQELTKRLHKKTESHSGGSTKLLAIVIAVALIAVIAVGVIAYMAGSSRAKSSGALVIEDTVTAVEDSEGMLTVDTENSKLKTDVVEEPSKEMVDLNTQMALNQAQDIDTANIINNISADDKSQSQSSQESLKVEVKEDSPLKAQSVAAADEQLDDPLKTVSLNSKRNTEDKKAENTDSLKAVSSKKEVSSVKKEELKAKNKEQTTSSEADSQKTEKKTRVILSNSLKDISSSARLSGKIDPFESLNSVTVRVNGEVALKINDQNKVIKQGSYKSGDVVKVSGIPPIRVSVSDTSKVRITYRGTNVSIPNTTQATFALPQK